MFDLVGSRCKHRLGSRQGGPVLFLAKRLTVAGLFTIPAVLGLTAVSAGASSGAPVLSSGPQAAGPVTSLTGSGHSVVFSPKSLTGDVVPKADCAPSNDTFSITNNTPKAEKITRGGKVIVRIPAGEYTYMCISTAGTEKFGVMSDPSAKLKVTAVAGT